MPLPQKTYLPSEVVNTVPTPKPKKQVYDIPHDLEVVPDLYSKADIQEWMGRFLQYQPDIIAKEQQQTVTLVSSQAKEIGQDIPNDWRLKVYPSAAGQSPYYEYITDDGWIATSTGEFISPTGKTMTYEDMLRDIPRIERPESIFGEYKPATLPQKSYLPSQVVIQNTGEIPSNILQELRNDNPDANLPDGLTYEELRGMLGDQQAALGALQMAIGDVFTVSPQDVTNIMDWLDKDEANQDEFLEMIWRVGDTAETRQLLSSLGATEDIIPEFFGAIATQGNIQALLDPGIISGQIVIPEAGMQFPSQTVGGVSFNAVLRPDGSVWMGSKQIGEFDLSTGAYKDYSAEGIESMPTWARVWGSGWGDVSTSAAGAAKRLGLDSAADWLYQWGTELQGAGPDADIYTPKYSGIKQITETEFWYGMLKSLPYTQALLPAFLAGGVGGGVLAGSMGLGTTGTVVTQSLVAGGISAVGEGLMEGGNVYNEAVRRGFTEEQAKEAFDKVFLKNVGALSGTNALQFALAFMPIKAPAGALGLAGKMAGGVVSEGGEEVLQEIFSRQALGDAIAWDKSMEQQFLAGAVMGGLFTAGGNVMQRIQDRSVSSFTPELKTEFDTVKESYQKQGMDETQATQKAFEQVVKTEEGQKVVSKVVNEIKQEEEQLFKEEAGRATEKTLKDIAEKADKLNIPQVYRYNKTKIDKEIDHYDSLIGRKGKVYSSEVDYESPYYELSGLQGYLETEPLATARFNMGGKSVGIDAFISIREQNFPEYFTIKQAEALFPGHDFVDLTNKNRVPRDAALDDLTKRFNMSADEIAAQAEQIRQYKAKIKELKRGAALDVSETTETTEISKSALQIERARLEAKKQIIEAVDESKGSSSVLSNLIDDSIAAIRDEIGDRSLSYIGNAKVGSYSNWSAKQLEAMLEVFNGFKTALAANAEITSLRGEIQKLRKYYTGKIKTMAEVKQMLFDLVKTLPLEVRGKMLGQIKNIKTHEDLTHAFTMAGKYAEQHDQKVLRQEIIRELKLSKPTRVKGILKGRFTAEVQDKLDIISRNIEGDRDLAIERVTENIIRYEDGKLSHEAMVEANDLLGMVGIKQMASDELRFTLDNIRSLKEIGRTLRQEQQGEYFAKLENLREEAVNVITGGKGLKIGTESLPARELEAEKGKFEKLVNRQYSWDNLLDKMSKLDKASKPYQSTVSKIGQGVHLSRNMELAGTEIAFKKLVDAAKKIFNIKTKGELNHLLNRLQNEKINLGTFQDMDGNTITLNLTKDQMIKKYQEISDPTLEETFREGMKWTYHMEQALIKNLTSEEKAWGDYQMDFYQQYYENINLIYRAVYGLNLPHNPNYSPIGRELDATIPENVLMHKDASRYASVLNGSLKSRVHNRIPLKFNGATEVLINHITQMEHFKGWAHTIMDLRRVFGNKEVRTAIVQYHGKDMLNLIDEYMNDFARGGINRSKIVHQLDTLRRNFTKAVLGFKPSIALKQIPSVMAFMTEMNVGDFASGVADFWMNPVKNYRFMMEHSPYMRARFGTGFERDIKYAMTKGSSAKQITNTGSVSDWFFTLIRTGDKFAVTQGMWAKYTAERKAGKTLEEAINAAEQSTKRTQPTSEMETLSAIQRGGSFWKLLTMFQNQPNKYFRIMGDNFRNLVYHRGSPTKAVSNILLVWVVLPVLFQIVGDAFKWRKEHQLRAITLGPMNNLLVIGQIAQSLYNTATGENWQYNASPVISTIGDIQIAIQKAFKARDNLLDPYKQITMDDLISTLEYVAKAAGQFGGVPTPYFIQVEKAIRDGKWQELIFSRYSMGKDTVAVDPRITAIEEKYGEMLAKYEGASEDDSIFYIVDEEERQEFRDKLLADNPDFADARRELDALDMEMPDDLTPQYVEYGRLVDKYGANSAEAMLYRLDHQGLQEFGEEEDTFDWNTLELEESDISGLRLTAKNREAIDLKDSYADKHSDNFIKDEEERKKAYEKLYNDYPGFKDDERRIDAYKKGATDDFAEKQVEYGHIVDEFGGSSAEAKLFKMAPENVEWFRWGRSEDTYDWGNASDWNEATLEINARWRELDDQYDNLKEDKRGEFLADNPEYHKDRLRRDAYSQGYSKDTVENYVEYSLLPEKGDYRERYLLDPQNAKFYKKWLSSDVGEGHSLIDETKVSPEARDKLYTQYQQQFDEWNDVAGLTDKQIKAKRDKLLAVDGFNEARYKIDAYDKGIPENLHDDYVGWYSSPDLVKPEGWKYDWWEDDRYLMEHRDFYQMMLDTEQWTEPWDFSGVPTREVESLYQIYQDLPSGTPRVDYRAKHPDLDKWLVAAKGLKPVADRGNEQAEKTPWEEAAEAEATRDYIQSLTP